MQGTTGQRVYQLVWWVLYGLAALSIIGLALLGQMPEGAAGWLAQPAVAVGAGKGCRCRTGPGCGWGAQMGVMVCYWRQSWPPVLLRSLVLWGLWAWSGGWGPAALRWLPWGVWLWRGIGLGWPGLRQRAVWHWVEWGLWQGQRLVLVGYAGLLLSGQRLADPAGWGLGLGCVICAPAAGSSAGADRTPSVGVTRRADGSYQVTRRGQFSLAVADDHPFRLRLWVLFLSLLDEPGAERGSRRTRDGRTPFVRQMQLAEWFGVPQPHISRWLGYWLTQDWANLLSLHSPEVLTAELVARIVTVYATFPTWGVEQVYQHLRQQGVAVTLAQVRQAGEQSGWQRLRQTLTERYDLCGNQLRVRDAWLATQLLTQVRDLLAQLEDAGQLPPHTQVAVSDLTALAAAAGGLAEPPLKALPWLLRLEQLVLGDWQLVSDGQVRCPACGSDQVGRKSAQPRLKKYYDATHQVCEVAVYRYYCRNSQCAQGSFTHLPPGLVPYSRHRTEVHLLAVQMYAWGYSTYRRTGTALGVASLTAWRWVSAWGAELLPVAALFGVVRSSGVVGVDEKWVLVPKNTKPAGERRRWMYVYLAADVWTYDLLHIAIYPHNDSESAQAFLLAVRAKGYRPQVIVTDLRLDYGPVIASVFPQAAHHECIFHALQQVQKHVKDAYGPDYAEQYPEAQQLKQQIYRIFDAQTLALATARYTAVMVLRPAYVQARPEAAALFDFLERHWPRLANSIGSSTIPATNNTVERVIGRFDVPTKLAHYQNFCGFESITTAQHYLGGFEKLYRFTPFSQDAQPQIRGKCPLQLAGYDISQLPLATICAGLSIVWPLRTQEAAHVPSP